MNPWWQTGRFRRFLWRTENSSWDTFYEYRHLALLCKLLNTFSFRDFVHTCNHYFSVPRNLSCCWSWREHSEWDMLNSTHDFCCNNTQLVTNSEIRLSERCRLISEKTLRQFHSGLELRNVCSPTSHLHNFCIAKSHVNSLKRFYIMMPPTCLKFINVCRTNSQLKCHWKCLRFQVPEITWATRPGQAEQVPRVLPPA